MLSCLHFEQARDGNALATAAVVETLRPRLTSMAAHYARCSSEDPDDLLQEAWMGLLEALPDLDVRIGSPEHYLIQRARWRLLDAIKYARVRRCAHLDSAVTDELDGGPVTRPHDDIVIARMGIEAFAADLKSVQRAVLLCLLQGMTWREAGATVGCSSANIAYHVRQIRKRYEVWVRSER